MFDMKGFVFFLMAAGAVAGLLVFGLVRWLFHHLHIFWT